jgi:hypothetical protein
MFSLFESLKSLTKFREIAIDNFTFRLHYRLTSLFLIIGSILITCYQYWGKPISCRTNEGEAPQSVLDYCWVSSTFTLPKYTQGRIGKDHIYPGVAGHNNSDEKKYHTYYQWVCIVLFAQGKQLTFHKTISELASLSQSTPPNYNLSHDTISK